VTKSVIGVVPPATLVAFLYKVTGMLVLPLAVATVLNKNTKTLFVEEIGVILADKFDVTKLVEVVLVVVLYVALTTCNTVPAVADVRTVPVNAGSVSV